MRKMLVTGGTVFVSRYIAEYYAAKGWDVFVLNRNTKQQSENVTLIEADRHALGETLREYRFDAVVDTAYTAADVELLLDALVGYEDYILISSSAVYPEHAAQPFGEDTLLGFNKYWGKYGTDKIAAEQALLERNPNAYVLRPPYLYGPMNNVYREAFVFDCAMADRVFYLPKDGILPLQFFHVHDLCRFMDVLLEQKPRQHIFNVGNKETVSVREWVELCYQAAGKRPVFRNVGEEIEQRKYFSFYDYAYALDVSAQYAYLEDVTPLKQGLEESFAWYVCNRDKVTGKPFFAFIDSTLAKM